MTYKHVSSVNYTEFIHPDVAEEMGGPIVFDFFTQIREQQKRFNAMSPDEKKAYIAERKAEREAIEAEHEKDRCPECGHNPWDDE